MWKKGPGASDKYEGEYIADKKHGYGIFSWAAGNVYKGHYLGFKERLWRNVLERWHLLQRVMVEGSPEWRRPDIYPSGGN